MLFVEHNVKTAKYDVSRSTPTFSMISVRSSVYLHAQSINVSNEIVFHWVKYDYSALYIYIYIYLCVCVCVCVWTLMGTRWCSWFVGHAVAQLVEAQSYKSEGHVFDSRWWHWRNPSGHTMALGSTQPLTEMSTRNIFWGSRRQVRRADNLTTFMCRLSWNLGASTS